MSASKLQNKKDKKQAQINLMNEHNFFYKKNIHTPFRPIMQLKALFHE